MSTPDNIIPISVQKGLISASLNASMLLTFLTGIYTMVYGATMYLYISKRPSKINGRIVLTAISVLYMLSLLNFVIQWYILDWVIVHNGDTRDSIFWGILGGLPWSTIIVDILFNSLFVVSDGLLIWRCYHAWGQSLRVVAIPSVLLVAEFGLIISSSVLDAELTQVTSVAKAVLGDNITSALSFISLGTTATTTLLIGYRIHSTTRLHGSPSSKRTFNHIVVIIVESAAAYSLALLLYAITVVVPAFNTLGSPVVAVGYYAQAVLIFVAGVAPTILVARIAVTDDRNTVAASAPLTHVSGLHFGSERGGNSEHSDSGTGEYPNTLAQVNDRELNPVPEKLKREYSVHDSSSDSQV